MSDQQQNTFASRAITKASLKCVKGVSKLKRLYTVLGFTMAFMGNDFELKNILTDGDISPYQRNIYHCHANEVPKQK
jgi:hypothetical protein